MSVESECMILHLLPSELQYASQQDCVLMEEQLVRKTVSASSKIHISANSHVAVVSIVEGTLIM